MKDPFRPDELMRPNTPRQRARRAAMLDKAAELGAIHRFGHIAMSDVATASGVAPGTIYRYFRSKTHLFATLFQDRSARFVDEHWKWTGPDCATLVADNLVALNRSLRADQRLYLTMLRAAAAAYVDRESTDKAWTATDEVVNRAILTTLDKARPTENHENVALLVTYNWWGALSATLTARLSPPQSDRQLHLATRLLLAHLAE